MFPQAKVVAKAKKAIELLYVGTCSIYEHQKVVKANKSTGFSDVEVLKDQACRLSFRTINSNSMKEEGASSLEQITVLFLDPDINVKPGSKIVVTQDDVTTDYTMSGKPAMYDTHQEIVLDLFRGWS